eukprot:5250655-Pleurochrysis_carterae.AAC.1
MRRSGGPSTAPTTRSCPLTATRTSWASTTCAPSTRSCSTATAGTRTTRSCARSSTTSSS